VRSRYARGAGAARGGGGLVGSGILAGITGLLLADLDTLDPTTLTFLVIFTVAAALIADCAPSLSRSSPRLSSASSTTS